MYVPLDTVGINLKSKLPVPFPVMSGYTVCLPDVVITSALQFAAKAPAPNKLVTFTVNVVSPPEFEPLFNKTEAP